MNRSFPVCRRYRFLITIDKSGFIGKGFLRECYRHPENKHLCVKVIWAGQAKESQREKRYYRHLEKRGISWDMIPRYYGDIETNLGPGSVFDLIVDHDFAVSKSLEYYLSSEEKTKTYYDSLSNSLYLLKDYLFQNLIITRDLEPSNILCRKTKFGISRLFIVDNIGNTDFIPICTYSNYFALTKISRKWQRFEDSMLNSYKHNNVMHRMFTSLQSRALRISPSYGPAERNRSTDHQPGNMGHHIRFATAQTTCPEEDYPPSYPE
jgi:hypothetical protein